MTTGTDLTPPADAVPSAPRRRLVTTRIAWSWVALSSLAIAVFTIVPYLTASLADLSDAGVGLADNYDGRQAVVQAAFYAHIVAGGLALIAGPFQFWRGLRDRHRSVHRWIGRTYLAAVAIAGGVRTRDGAVQRGGVRRVLRLRHARRPLAGDRLAGLPCDPAAG